MRRKHKATLAIPLAILVLGFVIPVVVRSGGQAPRRPAQVEEPRHAGRTATEWHGLAVAALERGDHNRAIAYVKTAEKVEPGVQYAGELHRVRRARWRVNEIARGRDRFLSGQIECLEFDTRGGVLVAYRTTLVLPGESLWGLARSCVAAGRGVLPSELPRDDREAYRFWDRMTDLNGVRELEVGEWIRVPLPEREENAIAAANTEDLARIERASRALAEGHLETASELRDAVAGAFARGTDAFGALEADLRMARRESLVAGARAEDGRVVPWPRTRGKWGGVSARRTEDRR